ncbi:hypothetical protein GBA52_003892 [Prunus armeniaca]|nr:hypothetical protein GBA52_003892 [Prunus armeniaca]
MSHQKDPSIHHSNYRSQRATDQHNKAVQNNTVLRWCGFLWMKEQGLTTKRETGRGRWNNGYGRSVVAIL